MAILKGEMRNIIKIFEVRNLPAVGVPSGPSAIRGPPIPQTTRWLPAVVDQHIAPAANGLSTDHGKEGEMYRGREQRGREVGPFRGIDTYFVYHLIDAADCIKVIQI
ncbi:hypothetical protein PCH_Pc13g07530 [Penicillium rubens Wisconsin 54-1255]|uniref:Uncharacterized protein n=1 Tax=Penicillium rubens (strain ATCC 28089 / DSM 1075 / NRRL 1951 / Wisconsin 54-1255) TaxID=500485 RepID=B6H3R1_PENRW|nr:hypothetical protein PCH_Pc13g07530 [Penicillium rubens Wisconsin 54-1255]